jgi:hypothetical protein
MSQLMNSGRMARSRRESGSGAAARAVRTRGLTLVAPRILFSFLPNPEAPGPAGPITRRVLGRGRRSHAFCGVVLINPPAPFLSGSLARTPPCPVPRPKTAAVRYTSRHSSSSFLIFTQVDSPRPRRSVFLPSVRPATLLVAALVSKQLPARHGLPRALLVVLVQPEPGRGSPRTLDLTQQQSRVLCPSRRLP